MSTDFESQMKDMDERLCNIEVMQEKTYMLLSGNPLSKTDEGLLGVVYELKKRVDTLEKFKDKLVYIGLGVGLFAGWGISDFIKAILLKN